MGDKEGGEEEGEEGNTQGVRSLIEGTFIVHFISLTDFLLLLSAPHVMTS